MISLNKITKEFDLSSKEKLIVLNGVCYTFLDYGLYCILGQSGTGKTTLLDIIGAIDLPSSGEIFYDGLDLSKLNEKEKSSYLNNIVSFIFQDNNLIDSLTVEENIILGLATRKLNNKEKEIELLKVLKVLNLTHKRNEKVKFLSGGEKQKVTIARALIRGARVILADEPTGSLDEKNSQEIMKILKGISKEYLVIMVTHNEKLAEEYHDVILRLDNGSLIEDKRRTSDVKNINETSNNRLKPAKRLSLMEKWQLVITNLKSRFIKTGIINFALVMLVMIISSTCLISNGFKNYLNELNNTTFTKYPISIDEYTTNINKLLNINNSRGDSANLEDPSKLIVSENTNSVIKNNITNTLISTIESMPNEYKDNLIFTHSYGVDALIKNSKQEINHITYSPYGFGDKLLDATKGFLNILPESLDILNSDYEPIKGRIPQNKNECVMIVSSDNSISKEYLNAIGLGELAYKEDLSADDFIGKTFKFVNHNNLYKQLPKTQLVSGIFFKREYEMINDHLSFNELVDLLVSNYQLLSNLNSSADLMNNDKLNQLFKDLYPYFQKTRVYDLENVDFGNKDQVEEVLLSLITKRNLNCYEERDESELLNAYDTQNDNEAKIVGIYKLKKDKIIDIYRSGVYFNQKIIEDTYKSNHPDFIDEDGDGKLTYLEDKRSNIIKSFESNFYINYDGTFNINTPTIFNDISFKNSDLLSFYNNLNGLGMINKINSIVFYPKDKKSKEYFINLIAEYNENVISSLDKITLLDISGTAFNTANEIFDIVITMLITISILISIISAILVGVILYDFINAEIHNIGIYLSLGISKKSVASVNVFEGVIFGVISTSLGVTLSYLITLIISNFLKPKLNFFGGFTLINVSPLLVCLILSISFVTILILHFLPIFKINKLTVKEVLRK